MIKGIHHVAISTPDLQRLKSFYVEKLGFTEVFSYGWPQGTEISDSVLELENSSADLVMLLLGQRLP